MTIAHQATLDAEALSDAPPMRRAGGPTSSI